MLKRLSPGKGVRGGARSEFAPWAHNKDKTEEHTFTLNASPSEGWGGKALLSQGVCGKAMAGPHCAILLLQPHEG